MSYRHIFLFATLAISACLTGAQPASVAWKHLSTKNGDLEAPNGGTQQCSATVFDIDKDGVNDFVITERTAAPGVVWYRRGPAGWTRYIMEPEPIHIEAGASFLDVDGDGDLDFVAAGDYKSNQIWWWENPNPRFEPKTGWKRHIVKDTGAAKHHDTAFGDFDGDGRQELVFWNQGSNGLFLARIPENPRTSGPWPLFQIYGYAADSEPQQRGTPESFKGINEHEGLAVIDIDGDGKLDVVGGGRWFKHISGTRFQENLIDPSYPFSRCVAGRLLKGAGRPQVVLAVGDGRGPMLWYEWVKGAWIPHKITDVDSAHSLSLVDFNNDGNLDIFFAEMRLNNRDPEARTAVLLGDGHGNFAPMIVARGFGLHESKMADLDGDGTPDILGKPYNWETPRLDIWLNKR